MSTIIESIEQRQLRRVPRFAPGDRVRVHSPKVERLEVVARGEVRRAKLYYLRGRVGKRARVAERRWGIEDDLVITEEEEAVDSEGVAQSEAESTSVTEEGEEEGEGAAESQ